ncbi:putative FAD NAD-P-binding domain-containing protein [Lyophyllum shimeji]|uniref:FAD NAD-P-binding domain-containing protein n=1 Tax=Lyophyllum shimeji TaxID=47721 RepID=A0A9P3PTW2_LYOSH|nr:putative FAD NAD-P-binding domain-containing protein [Lyophyllum shimeji]
MSKKNIVIVGGGSGGANAARALSRTLDSSNYQLILINPLPYRIWLVGTLRAIVTNDETLKNDVMISYDKVFVNGNGKFVEGTVKSFEATKEGGTVTLESGEKIDYHVLVLAQGMSWTGPPAFPRTDDGVKEHISTLHGQLSKANDIVLVGGGAVGIELAGEIKDQWPNKKVTIVHGDKHLMNDAYPVKYRKAAEASVLARDIKLVLDDFVDHAGTGPVNGITTRSGKELVGADLVVQTRGPRPNTEFVSASLGPAALSEKGLIRIRPTMQLAEYDNIFAAGDVIDWQEQKQAAKSSAHGLLVAANIQAYLNKGTLKPYKGASEMIVVTNGKAGGFGYLGILWGITLGAWFARMVKSKTLLIPMFKAEQGL